ncbi:hypothetical protein ACFQL4_05420 [Halosimplex aquaticum]
MASLTEVYEGHLRTVTTSRRFYAGASLFAVGAAMVVGSIAVSTTTAGASLGLDQIAARTLAGTLAGLGCRRRSSVSSPSSRRGGRLAPSPSSARASASSASPCSASPTPTSGSAPATLAIATVVVYFFGAMTTLSCLFAGLATFKTRNDPGGTARMEITESGNVRLVEDAEPSGGLGSVGFLGNDPQGEVRTQTNREDQPSTEDTPSGHDAEILSGPGEGPAPTADGGSATVDDRTDAEFIETANQRGRPDAYCGNCAHFEYVKVDEKITPYCGLHDELMEDMDACDQWVEAE